MARETLVKWVWKLLWKDQQSLNADCWQDGEEWLGSVIIVKEFANGMNVGYLSE